MSHRRGACRPDLPAWPFVLTTFLTQRYASLTPFCLTLVAHTHSLRKATSEKPNSGPSSRERELERLLSQHGIALPSDSLAPDYQPPPAERVKSSEPPSGPPARSSLIRERHTIPGLVSDERTPQPLSPHTASTLLEAALEPTGLEAFVEATNRLEAAAQSQSQSQIQAQASMSFPPPPARVDPPSHSPNSSFPARPPSRHSVSRSTLTDPDREAFPYDDGLSSGTLVIAAGRSKYFGPRAGNEWLKDVSVLLRAGTHTSG